MLWTRQWMQGGVGGADHPAARTQGSTHDFRLRGDRGEGSRPHLGGLGFAHIRQRAAYATADHDQFGVEDIEKRCDRDSQVMTGGGEGFEREFIAAASL